MIIPINYRKATWQERKKIREEYIIYQKGLCSHCGGDLNQTPPKKIMDLPKDKSLFLNKFFDYPIHLHHSHDTGMTEGVVHAQCNAVLWQYFEE